ncbi:MAG: hypothetical protein R3324_12415, partial [Halobacteriales archaeon]|nr:hypothetical protein [Halobacteriales archaeon]
VSVSHARVALRAVARSIYQEQLPDSPFELADREFFEVLPPSYRPDDPEATESIWIPIQEQNS